MADPIRQSQPQPTHGWAVLRIDTMSLDWDNVVHADEETARRELATAKRETPAIDNRLIRWEIIE